MPDEYDDDLKLFSEFVANIQATELHKKWAQASPGEATKWASFRSALLAGQKPTPPAVSSRYAKHLVSAGKMHMSISHLVGLVRPEPPPPPAPAVPLPLAWTSSIADNDTIVTGTTWTVTVSPPPDSVEFWVTPTAGASQLLKTDTVTPFDVVLDLDAGTYILGICVWHAGVRFCFEDRRNVTVGGVVSPPSTARWNGDLETGDKSQYVTDGFYTGPNPDRVTIVTSDGAVTPRQGNYMARCELRNGDTAFGGNEACGLIHGPMNEDRISGGVLGSTVYMGHSLYLKSPWTWANNQLHNIFTEWHGDNNYQAAMHLLVNRGNPVGSLTPTWAVTRNWIPPGNISVTNLVPVELDVWWDFVFRHTWSQGGTGLTECWIAKQGSPLVKLMSVAGPNWYTSGQTSVRPQFIYYRPVTASTNIFYYDGMKIGASYASVAPL